MDIKNLDLSEEDFQLLIEGLEALPEKGMAGEVMGDLLSGMLCRDNPEAQEKFKRERERDKLKKEGEKQRLKEDIRILQGKLLLLKRWLTSQGALKQTYDILNNPLK